MAKTLSTLSFLEEKNLSERIYNKFLRAKENEFFWNNYLAPKNQLIMVTRLPFTGRQPLDFVKWNNEDEEWVDIMGRTLRYKPTHWLGLPSSISAKINPNIYLNVRDFFAITTAPKNFFASSSGRRRIRAKTMGRCAYCGEYNSFTIDHVRPVSKRVSNGIKNLVVACLLCNQAKRELSLDEFHDALLNLNNTKRITKFYIKKLKSNKFYKNFNGKFHFEELNEKLN